MLLRSYAATTEVMLFFFSTLSSFYQQSLGQCFTANGQIAVGGETERAFMPCAPRTMEQIVLHSSKKSVFFLSVIQKAQKP